MPFPPFTLPGIFHEIDSAAARRPKKAGTDVHPSTCSGIFFLAHCIVMSRPWGGSYIQTWERDNTMSQSLVEIAKDLTVALIETRSIPPDSIQETLQHTYATLTTLKAQEEGELPSQIPAPESPLVEWRKSITKHTVTCLECR